MKINEMTVQELVTLEDYVALAKEANKASNIILECFHNSFGIDGREIEVYSTEENGEYYGHATLSVDGVWHYHDNWWGGRDWEIKITPDGIFKYFKVLYQIENLIEPDFELVDKSPVVHFRRFIENCRKKIE